MGRGFVQYHLPESGRDEWVGFSAFINYCLHDGTLLHILQQPGWCPTCDRFVIAEVVPSVDALEEEIARYRSGDPDTLQEWAFISQGAPVTEQIAELLRRIKWRQRRQSPPRCLECGEPDCIPIPVSGEFSHPQTRERVEVINQGWADTATWEAGFTPEGERLAEPSSAVDHRGG
jgi:hypothetical protein